MIAVGRDFRAPQPIGEVQILFIILALAAIVQQDQSATYTLTSWYRTPQRNIEVGGVANSLHVQGLALDVAIDAGFFANVFQSIRDELAGVPLFQRGLQGTWRSFGPSFQAVVESDHVHLELDLN